MLRIKQVFSNTFRPRCFGRNALLRLATDSGLLCNGIPFGIAHSIPCDFYLQELDYCLQRSSSGSGC